MPKGPDKRMTSLPTDAIASSPRSARKTDAWTSRFLGIRPDTAGKGSTSSGKVMAAINKMDKMGGPHSEYKKSTYISRLRSRMRSGGRKLSDAALHELDLAEVMAHDFVDVAQILGLSAYPMVLEIGEESLLKLKKSGNLDSQDDNVIAAFKKHKATIGKSLFEAENTNNWGVEMYLLGDYHTASDYFSQALKLTSEKKKSAATELAILKAFIKERYDGSEEMLYTELVKGEWRSALGHKKFVEALSRLDYPGDADRVFTMLDSVANDGKVSLPELISTLKAKTVRLNSMDREPVQKGIVLSNLACCLLQRGDIMSALQCFREALRIVRRVAGKKKDSDDSVVTIMANVATAYIHLGDTDAALHALSVVLERREMFQGRLHEDALAVLYLTGYAFLVKANRFQIVHDRLRMDSKKQDNPVHVNYHLALCAFKERLSRQQASLTAMPNTDSVLCDIGARHQLELHIARSHEIIAEVHDKCEDLERARDHLMASLQYKKEILDASDPDLFSTLNMYASVCARSGRDEEALESMSLAMRASEELFGYKSAAVATQLFHLGLLHLRIAFGTRKQRKGDVLRKSVEQLQQCLSIRSELFGVESEEVASTAHLLGSVHFAAGDVQQSRRSYERALLTRVSQSSSHATVACSAHALGSLCVRCPRRLDEGVVLLHKAAVIRRRQLGEDSIYLADTLHELGAALLLRQKDNDAHEALAHLSQAAAIREGTLGKKNAMYAASLHQLGQAHLILALPMEARRYLQASLGLRERLLGKHSAQAASSRAALGVASANEGDLNAALICLKIAYKDREHILGQMHPLSADTLYQLGLVLVCKQELEQALAALTQALKLFSSLNEEDVTARLADSDEEAIAQKVSERTRRVQARRGRKGHPEVKAQRTGVSTADGSRYGLVTRLVAKVRSKLQTTQATDAGEDGTEDVHTTKTLQEGHELINDNDEVCIEDTGVDVRGCHAPKLAQIMQTIALVHMDLREFARSKYWLDSSGCIREEIFGATSKEVGETMHKFGLLFRLCHDPSSALSYFRKALKARECTCGFAHASTAETCEQLAEVLHELGNAEEASIFMSKALAVEEQLPSVPVADLERTREKWNGLAAAGMEYDPVQMGEALPHISRRSAESYLHGWKDRRSKNGCLLRKPPLSVPRCSQCHCTNSL